MRFAETRLAGAFTIDLDRLEDDRGFFARSFCQRELRDHGIDFTIAQCNLSYNKKPGTLRGMHYQAAPHEEAKLVTCLRGVMHDVIIDLRHESPTYKEWTAVKLSAGNRRTLYIPAGFAHGFQTLEPDTEILYLMSNFYNPAAQRGILWNDACFDIAWPIAAPVLSARDQAHPAFRTQ